MRWPLVVNGLLLLVLTVAIGSVQVLDRSAASVDGSVRRYAAAISTSDLDAAVAEIAPAEQPRWRDWIRGQLGNLYDLRGVAVHAPALLDSRALRPPTDVTVVMDVNRGYPDEFYQPTTRVEVEQVDGRWYLRQPLLAPEALATS